MKQVNEPVKEVTVKLSMDEVTLIRDLTQNYLGNTSSDETKKKNETQD